MARGPQLYLFLALLLFAVAQAASAAERVPFPEIGKAQGETCVRGTGFMRENHMELLLHGRDASVQEGIRSSREGLQNCLDCHAVADTAGEPVGYENPRHFCRVCHDYAAVTIDCFQCHASRPARSDQAAGLFRMGSP